eukprot:TRINITY_DN1433_c0_g1_i11.p1 TRINITY_DN1433_c0_g1~~TRINITY_DN1433_c0_g1_i11.p1  ORF type:complete len:482 (+),score=128.95 TRINITY_DN1433_c0_g1_i11:1769-3214(+)
MRGRQQLVCCWASVVLLQLLVLCAEGQQTATWAAFAATAAAGQQRQEEQEKQVGPSAADLERERAREVLARRVVTTLAQFSDGDSVDELWMMDKLWDSLEGGDWKRFFGGDKDLVGEVLERSVKLGIPLRDMVLAHAWYEWQAKLLPLSGAPGLPLSGSTFLPPAYRGITPREFDSLRDEDLAAGQLVTAGLSATAVLKLHFKETATELSKAARQFAVLHVDDWPHEWVFAGFDGLRGLTAPLGAADAPWHVVSWHGLGIGTVSWNEWLTVTVDTRATSDFTLRKVVERMQAGCMSPLVAARLAVSKCQGGPCALELLRAVKLTAPAYFTVTMRDRVVVIVRDADTVVGERVEELAGTNSTDEFLVVGNCDWWRAECLLWDPRIEGVPTNLNAMLKESPFTRESSSRIPYGKNAHPLVRAASMRVTVVLDSGTSTVVVGERPAGTGDWTLLEAPHKEIRMDEPEFVPKHKHGKALRRQNPD